MVSQGLVGKKNIHPIWHTEEVKWSRTHVHPKTEIEIGWEAQKGLVGRAGRGYNRCGTNHNYSSYKRQLK
jgi:hypothetical protein